MKRLAEMTVDETCDLLSGQVGPALVELLPPETLYLVLALDPVEEGRTVAQWISNVDKSGLIASLKQMLKTLEG